MCDVRVHACKWEAPLEVRLDAEGVVLGPVRMARLHLDVRRGQLRGAKLGGKAQGLPFHPGDTGEEKTGGGWQAPSPGRLSPPGVMGERE